MSRPKANNAETSAYAKPIQAPSLDIYLKGMKNDSDEMRGISTSAKTETTQSHAMPQKSHGIDTNHPRQCTLPISFKSIEWT
jgi:hypothetical protein